jgi:uncharacterized membrane protein YraQ (UPF0718 family)
LNQTVLLAIATLALVVGPLLDRIARRWPSVPALIDGATVGGIVVVSFLHLIPEAGAHLGLWALVLMTVGLLLPVYAEKMIAASGDHMRISLGVLVVALFLAHEAIESAALASVANDERVGIATLLVVVGHRLPLGLLLWGHTRRRFGVAWSLVALAAVASFTWFGPLFIPIEPGAFTAVLSALLAGGLLHLVLQHAPSAEHAHEHERTRHAWSALGLLLAVAFFVPYLMGGETVDGHDHGHSLLPERLRELVLETSVPLLIGVVGAALIEAFLPGSISRWLSGGSRLRRALAGVAVGTPMPVCSCGILPIYRSLMRKGVSATAALALLVAGPELDLAAILLSWPMLGGPTTIARIVCALVLALVVALVVGGAAERHRAPVLEHAHLEPRPSGAARAISHGLFETWAHLAPWILFGLLLTAIVEPLISTEWASAIPPWAQVFVLCLAGLPAYICATAATPFAALLLAKGFAPGAVIAFLLTGPATNFTTFGALRRLHNRRVAVLFVAVSVGATCVLGLAVDALLGSVALVPPTEAAHEHEHGVSEWVAAGLLLALTVWVIFRSGPRPFLAQLWQSDGDAPHTHAHDHEHAQAPTH